MSVVISDALARDVLWWVQNNPVPYVTVGEHYERCGRNQKPMMEIARDSMVEELKGAIDKPKVCLTVEEAKTVYEALNGLCATVESYERERDTSFELVDGWNQMDFLDQKIEQVEGRNEG